MRQGTSCTRWRWREDAGDHHKGSAEREGRRRVWVQRKVGCERFGTCEARQRLVSAEKNFIRYMFISYSYYFCAGSMFHRKESFRIQKTSFAKDAVILK